MKIIQHHASIYEILDFLSKEEQNILTNILAKVNDYNLWEKQDSRTSNHNPDNEVFLDNLKDIVNDSHLHLLKDIAWRFKDIFNTSPDSIDPFDQILRMGYNFTLNPHTDNLINEAIDPSFKFTMVFYWNDDYEGGELHYPALNITIKPKQWSILMHEGHVVHQVLAIQSQGFRYSTPASVRSHADLVVQIK
jgi:hypothetical protein